MKPTNKKISIPEAYNDLLCVARMAVDWYEGRLFNGPDERKALYEAAKAALPEANAVRNQGDGMTKAQIEAFKKIKGPWGLKPCSHGGLIVVRGDGGPGGHEQSHVQIIPESDAIAFGALPDLLAEREKMIAVLRMCASVLPLGSGILTAVDDLIAEAEGGE